MQPQCNLNATLVRPSRHPGPAQFRNPKAEIRRKSETRSPKEASSDEHAAFWSGSWFRFGISGFLRLCGLALLRKGDGELGAQVCLAGDGGFAAVGFDDGFDQAQPEAQAALGAAFVAPVEA